MGLRVLVVDDQADLRLLLRMQLEVDGHDVVGEAPDGQSALLAAEQLAPDAVVLDRELPDGSGLDLIAALRAAQPGLRVVVVSGDPSGEQAALAAGADGYLDKAAPLGRLSPLLAPTP